MSSDVHSNGGHEVGEHDERDEAEKLRDPAPEPSMSPFARAQPDIDGLAPLAAAQVG